MAKTLALFFVLGMFVSCASQERSISSTSEAPVKEQPSHYYKFQR